MVCTTGMFKMLAALKEIEKKNETTWGELIHTDNGPLTKGTKK
jgi:hypothetical protein